VVKFKLCDNHFVPLWIDRLISAQQLYPIDDPERFYGFGSLADQITDAFDRINSCVTTINSYKKIITRSLTSVHDQDTLNYLHHIFEMHYGLLDQQNSNCWNKLPSSVQCALAELNLAVH
jgi:hypothetical protein